MPAILRVMRTLDIIAAKRDGKELCEDDIRGIVLGYVSGEVPDYQMSAFLMAIYLRGLSFAETTALTRAMIESGTSLDLSVVDGRKVDKHSTGGVGDKTTLVVVPILAACGLKVPKMSGRGLGFTGGTLDKLESIPGFETTLSLDRLIRQMTEIGAAMAGQTADIVPADKKIYALRDVTATVESIPLIAASIMSKKIACGSDVILLDVKAGSGAFAKSTDDARELALMMIAIGEGMGRTVGAAITDMSQPLGQAVGNALEVREAIDTLHGHGPADLTELSIRLSSILLDMADPGAGPDAARRKVEDALLSGAARTRFADIVRAQGGDERVVDDTSLLPAASHVREVLSEQAGVVTAIDTEQVGVAASILGAGRERKEDVIDPSVGLIIRKKLGDRVEKGDVLALVHANDPDRASHAEAVLKQSYCFGGEAVVPPLVHEVITGSYKK